MENTQQKTPEQWFQMLKEPYRSEAIKGINIYLPNFKKHPYSLEEALYYCILFDKEAGLTPTRNDWRYIYESIKAGETTYLEPETLKPEQMESGKWYFLDTDNFKWIIKFLEIEASSIIIEKAMVTNDKTIMFTDKSNHCNINQIKSIRHATKEEVLKYFPDEVFEPIELRPEDLVSGEVYTYINIADEKSILKFNGQIKGEEVYYYVKINERGVEKHNDWVSTIGSFYHATPEEKKLLLGEETTDWEAKYNELKANYELAKKEIEREKDLRDKWHNHYCKLKEEYNELHNKFDQLEPKGEKVYFFTDHSGNLRSSNDIQFALEKAGEDYRIYESNVIGKKKSVLVSE